MAGAPGPRRHLPGASESPLFSRLLSVPRWEELGGRGESELGSRTPALWKIEGAERAGWRCGHSPRRGSGSSQHPRLRAEALLRAVTAPSLLYYYLFRSNAVPAARGVNRIWQGDSPAQRAPLLRLRTHLSCHPLSIPALGTLLPLSCRSRCGRRAPGVGGLPEAAGQAGPALSAAALF